MFLKLRVIFTILSAICIAAVVPVGVFLDYPWAILCAGLGGVFFLIMLFFKKKQEKKENPPTPQSNADFFHPVDENQTEKSDEK